MTNPTNEPDPFSPAFTMDAGDRFHSIMICAPVIFDATPKMETIMTFFVIRRSSGKYSIAHIIRTYDEKKCVSKKAHVKNDIPEQWLEKELNGLKGVTAGFTQSAKKEWGVELKWDVLELKDVTDMKEQVQRIQAWGKITAFVDTGEISLN